MRTPRFTFEEVGIDVGEELVFVPTGQIVKVASNREIVFEGRTYTLTGFVVEYIPQKKACGAYQGPRFFTYNGRLLTDIRGEILKKKRLEDYDY